MQKYGIDNDRDILEDAVSASKREGNPIIRQGSDGAVENLAKTQVGWSKGSPWSRWSGLNRRPTVYETVALPLSYTGDARCANEPVNYGDGEGAASGKFDRPRFFQERRPGKVSWMGSF